MTVDPVRFGELIQAMRDLEKQLDATRGEIAAFDVRLAEMEGRIRIGKGWLAGLAIGLGFAILGVKQTILAIFGKL